MSIGHVSGTMVGLVEQKRTRLTAPALLAWPASQERLTLGSGVQRALGKCVVRGLLPSLKHKG